MARGAPLLRESAFVDAPPASTASVPTPTPLEPRLPRWAADALAGGDLELLTASVPSAASMPVDRLRASVADAYAQVGESLRESGLSPIRVWNYLPDPTQAMTAELDRYMVFNAGRADGYRQWPGASDSRPFPATASGVGVARDDVTIHCLASPDAGTPVENPRQTSAWRYSARYGPVPPSFSRATIANVGGRSLLLIGGTASIVGEDSRHEHDAVAQLEETLTNLAALINAARQASETEAAALERLADLRVYLVRPHDSQRLWPLLRARCGARAIELTTARLCRRELLVEIEGVAELKP